MIKSCLLLGLVFIFAVNFGLIDLDEVRKDITTWSGDPSQPMTGSRGSDWG